MAAVLDTTRENLDERAEARFGCRLAQNAREVMASQRLRYEVFAEEMGARLESAFTGLDLDRFDPHCRHLLVLDQSTGQVVASTRILMEEGARAAGGFYSAGEFEMSAIAGLPGRIMEIGRTCVHPAYRSGAVIGVLWSGIAELVLREGHDYLIGCASITMEDGGYNALAVMERLRGKYMTPDGLRVHPRVPMPDLDASDTPAKLPPLVKAYVSLGARAAGDACWDADFNVADVFMLLKVADLAPRYARHFFKRPTPGTELH